MIKTDQAVIIAAQLRALGQFDTEKVTLETWLSLGFLQRPADKLLRRIASFLTDG